jgi:hypothetical protein
MLHCPPERLSVFEAQGPPRRALEHEVRRRLEMTAEQEAICALTGRLEKADVRASEFLGKLIHCRNENEKLREALKTIVSCPIDDVVAVARAALSQNESV